VGCAKALINLDLSFSLMTFSSSSIGAPSRHASPLDRHVASEQTVEKPGFTRGGDRAPASSADGNRPGVWLRQHVGTPMRTLAFNARHLGHNIHQGFRHMGHRQGTPDTPQVPVGITPQAVPNPVSMPLPTANPGHWPGYGGTWVRNTDLPVPDPLAPLSGQAVPSAMVQRHVHFSPDTPSVISSPVQSPLSSPVAVHAASSAHFGGSIATGGVAANSNDPLITRF
jgi:hypothetical protein